MKILVNQGKKKIAIQKSGWAKAPRSPPLPHPLRGPCYENGRLFHVKDIAITYVLRNRLGATCASSGKIFGGGTTSTQEKWAVVTLPLKSFPELAQVGLLTG